MIALIANYFFDTSALLKYYIEEGGSEVIRDLIEDSGNNTFVISALTLLEARSAIRRRARAGVTSAEQATNALEQIIQHSEDRILVRSLSSATMNEAERLIDAYSLRTLDALQLATCLIAHNGPYPNMTFVCADNRLLDAAEQEGLDILNPLDPS